jgi:glycosyltransferase involved in cell wall biosynthesis
MRRAPNAAERASTPAFERDLEGLRIALFSGNYNYLREGANQALNRLVGHLLDHGAKVRVYSPTTDTPAFEPVGDLVPVPSVTMPLRPEFRIALGLSKSVSDDIARFGPNVVHVSAPDWLGTAAQRVARQLHVPVVASMHTRFETYFQYYGLKALAGWAWRRQQRFYQASDRILVPNLGARRHIEAMGVPKDRIRTWSRGVDRHIFSPKARDRTWRRSLGYEDDECILLFFGRIVREKGPSTFAETVRLLRARGLKIRPLVVGDGPARDEFASALGEATFTGHLDGQALGRAIASADIMLNPSMTEAFGNVNLEAMASGLCVVSAEAPSATELIASGHDGLICEPRAEAYAELIERLTSSPDQRLEIGRNAAKVASKYSWDETLGAVGEVYSEFRSPH